MAPVAAPRCRSTRLDSLLGASYLLLALEPRVAGQVALPPSTAAATGRRALRTVGQVWARYSYRSSTQRRAAVGRRQTGPLVSTVMVGPRLRCKLPFRCLCWLLELVLVVLVYEELLLLRLDWTPPGPHRHA